MPGGPPGTPPGGAPDMQGGQASGGAAEPSGQEGNGERIRDTSMNELNESSHSRIFFFLVPQVVMVVAEDLHLQANENIF